MNAAEQEQGSFLDAVAAAAQPPDEEDVPVGVAGTDDGEQAEQLAWALGADLGLVGAAEAAKILGLSEATIRKYATDGQRSGTLPRKLRRRRVHVAGSGALVWPRAGLEHVADLKRLAAMPKPGEDS